ncbi:MAG: ATP-binding protein [Pikeienuella sp.]
MTGLAETLSARFSQARPRARGGGAAILALSLIGLALAGATTVLLTRNVVTPEALNIVLLVDLGFIVFMLGMIGFRVWRLLQAHRRRSAGARLHLRLTGIFAVVALAPAIIIAIFATISINVGIETWFSGQVGSVVRNSLTTAQAYADEHRRSIEREVLNMANDMNRAGALGISDQALLELLRRQQALRRFPETYLIDGARNILHRGDFSYSFTYDPPSDAEIADARLGRVVVVEDQVNNELRALVYLNNYIDTFLYVSRQVDGNVLLLLDETAETVSLYNKTEAARGRLLSVFALIYLGFAALVSTTAAWVGLWLAERLSRPIGALAAAAERVGEGDLDVKVPEENTRDEVALLSRVFNRMIAQVKGQHDALSDAHRESEQRRNFIETVLSGVSAGVIGLDNAGRVEMLNAAAKRMLEVDGEDIERLPPQMEEIFANASSAITGAAQAHVAINAGDGVREFLVRVAARSSTDPGQGYVMTLDDLTALVSAQREAAWGDVARRIAHEIKNPLTPIQLSAERLRRKFGPMAGEDRASFDQYADVIIRQAGDIRRMVDEFSRFARMPNPEAKPQDIAKLVKDAVLLQSSARPDVAYETVGADAPRILRCDQGMVSQALTNVLKNALEAVEQRLESQPDPKGRIRVTLSTDDQALTIAIDDNGVGLPKGDRARLTEPYVTTREKGTGLGLAIVKKICEQHGGTLRLENAHWEDTATGGARVALVMPLQGRT